jgi:hypothetical protein
MMSAQRRNPPLGDVEANHRAVMTSEGQGDR